jgi:hypothetical protein
MINLVRCGAELNAPFVELTSPQMPRALAWLAFMDAPERAANDRDTSLMT